MRLLITAVVGGAPYDVAADAEDDATVGDLAAALGRAFPGSAGTPAGPPVLRVVSDGPPPAGPPPSLFVGHAGVPASEKLATSALRHGVRGRCRCARAGPAGRARWAVRGPGHERGGCRPGDPAGPRPLHGGDGSRVRRRRGRPRAAGAVRTARRLRRRLRAGRAGAGAGRRHPARPDAQPPPGGADRPGHPHPRAHPQGPGARRVRPLRRHPDRRPRRRRAGAAPGAHPRRGRHGLGAGPDPGRGNRPARPRAHRCPRCLHVGQPNGRDAGLQPAASAAAAVTAHQLHPAQRAEEARQGAGAAADDHRADRHGRRRCSPTPGTRSR